MRYETETCGHRQQCGSCQKERGGGGVLTYGDGNGLMLGGGHTVQYTDHVS